jgi:HTH-type transcriptional regulator / antitoxin HigA
MTKTNGKMTLTFNPKTYSSLLSDALPQVIKTQEEYDRALKLIEPLHCKKSLTPEEDALYDLLSILIENYEDQHFSMPEAEPYEVLQHLLEVTGKKQAELVGIVGSSGVVSEIVNGKRAISKTQAKTLGEFFKVSPSLFI